MMRFLWICFLLTGMALAGHTQQKFEFNANCVKAYRLVTSLRPQPAMVLLEAEKKENPYNIVPAFIENYIDFFELFLNEDPSQFEKRKGNKKTRIAIIEAGPGTSPIKDFMLAIVQLQWAAIDMKFGNRMSGGWGFRDALKKARENQKKFPDFTPNLMILGPLQMAASTVPSGYKWLGSLMGVSGNLQTGKNQLSTFLQAKDPWAQLFMEEGIFYHCYLQYFLLNEPEDALSVIQKRKLDLVNNHLFTFMAANLHLNNKQSHLTKSIVSNRNKSADYMPTTIWDFEMAYAKLYHLEPDADIYFRRFLQNFKGTYYLKDAWNKLGYHYLIQGNTAEYKRCMQQVIRLGKQDSDADKQAHKEAASGKIPNTVLLKARLLSDGGYQREALAVLAGKSSNDFTDTNEKIEFTYRLGRIYDLQGRDDLAINAYNTTIALGINSPEYFAARSALQMGLIFEKKSNCAEAKRYYQRCIDMKNHAYENSLEQKAKAGIARCK